jgi:hypothetical protein
LQSLAAAESQALVGGPTAGAALRVGETPRAAPRGPNAAGSRPAGNSHPPRPGRWHALIGSPKSRTLADRKFGSLTIPRRVMPCARQRTHGVRGSWRGARASRPARHARVPARGTAAAQSVELVLANGLLVRIPAVAGHAIRTAIETAAVRAPKAQPTGRMSPRPPTAKRLQISAQGRASAPWGAPRVNDASPRPRPPNREAVAHSSPGSR